MDNLIKFMQAIVELNIMQGLLSLIIVLAYIWIVNNNPTNPHIPDLREFTNLILGVFIGGIVTRAGKGVKIQAQTVENVEEVK